MDLPHDTETIDDLSALAWVQDELRRSLEAAHKGMRRYLKEAEALAGSDIDAVDPGVLRAARAQLHQGVGALELVGLPAAAQLLRANEAALQKLSGRPVTLTAKKAETIEQASFALLDYLARLLASKPVSPLAMFPQYRAVQELAGADRIHPADLWLHDWQWHEIALDPTAPSRVADADLRTEIEVQTLALMRQADGPAAATLSDLFAGLAASARAGEGGGTERWLSTSWQLASAFFEAQAQGLLQLDVYSKRIASRLLAQLRMSERGDAAQGGEVSQRLAQDLLFFCAQAASPGDGRRAPRLAAVRLAWNLARRPPVDYLAAQLGRFDPAWIAQAKKRVGAAKESWSAVAGGELHRLSTLNEQFQLVGDSLKRLYPGGEQLAQALASVSAQTAGAGTEPAPALAMEVATAVLYLEASIEDAEFDHPTQAERVRRLAQRITAVQGGAAPEALEAWMEELYRRVSDRQTMGSVVQELRGALTESEKAIDGFFRQPAARELLHPVPAQLNAMRGVFSVLGLDHASQTVVRMRDDVDALATATSGGADGLAVERLASNLGALGFLIDMLSVQPAMAKSLFAFDAASGLLRSVAGGGSHRASELGALDEPAAVPPGPVEPRLIEQAQSLAMAAAHPEVPLAEVSRELERLSQEAMVADQPVLAETMQAVKTAFADAQNDGERQLVREELAQAMADFVHTSSQPAALDALPPSRPMPLRPAAPTPTGKTGLEEDDEMRAIFLEEAREVIGNAEQALAALVSAADDLGEMTSVRRAFHTLKGSSRMVGLAAFGEAAWSCEQLYNRRLADNQAADGDLLALTTDVLHYLGDWVEAIGERRDGGHRALDVQGAVDAFAIDGRHGSLGLPGTPLVLQERPVPVAKAAAPTLTMPQVSSPMPLFDLPDLPSAQDLELRPASAAVQPIDQLLAADEEVAFELDLGDAAGLPVAGKDAMQALATPEREGDAPSPDPVSSMMSLDIEEAPAPAPVPTPRGPVSLSLAEAPSEPPAEVPEPLAAEPEPFKMIGPLRVGIPLFNIFLNEADEQSRRLCTELAEWAHELHRPVGDHAVALAHSLAGNSATVGFSDLSQLARLLEHALARSMALRVGDPTEAALFNDSADEIRRLLHQFAAGFLKAPPPELVARLVDHERLSAERLHAQALQPEPSDSTAEAHPSMLDEAPPMLPTAEAVELPPVLTEQAAPLPAAALKEDLLPAETPQAELLPEPPPLMAPSAAPASAPAEAQDSGHSPLPLGRPQFHALTELSPLAEARHITAPAADRADDDDEIDAVDAIDAELFPIFEEEAAELLPQLASRMRDWAERPGDAAGPAACMRTLHTLKGGARLAGAMRLGERAHRLETAIERLAHHEVVTSAAVEALFTNVDAIGATFDALGRRSTSRAAPLDAAPAVEAAPPSLAAPARPLPLPPAVPVEAPATPSVDRPRPTVTVSGELAPIDWQRFAAGAPSATVLAELATERRSESRPGTGTGTVRVQAPLLDRLVNHAGEVSIARSRIEAEVGQLKGSLTDLTENLERLRHQLREIELQAETQIGSRMEAAKAEGHAFDPLEMDRFTRFQELTRMMAESVNDVATVQRSLQRTLQSAEDDLAAQARLTRDLQDDLLRTRMVEFESLSDRLYRVVRQAAKELNKQVRLDLVGGSIEVDRGVLERMAGAFEHLLRNCVTHGIESPAERQAAGKEAAGLITVAVSHEGNEVAVEFRDDGGGLNLARIRERGAALGLIGADASPGDGELAQLIFTPGFSTADAVTELAGRGIGMDVVRAEVNALGGRIETATALGQGTSFRLVLPLTTAVTQVVMLRAGAITVAVPATLIEIVRRATAAEVAEAYATGSYLYADTTVPFFWLGALLQAGGRSTEPATSRSLQVVVVKSAQQRIVLHVDEVAGNQEVVVKNLGPQLSRLPGLAGITLLASGAPALIYNPVALATLYGDAARLAMRDSARLPLQPASAEAAPARLAPLVLVVDDSLTVRRVTQRLLVREGYRVVLAKDGLDAIDKLAEEKPAVVLSDIEMPRMDGFDLVRNLRADARLRDLPVIMITSRIAQKHRDHAAELGVDHYLGKPYSEEDLLALVAQYTAAQAAG
jgi:chemosensory pili system protein ChpA (sensor histidine kinase/response regulator)